MNDTSGPAAAKRRTPAKTGAVVPVRCNAFWIGERLGPMAVACLRFFVRAGHEVVLHVYDEPVDVPEGVTVREAGLLVPADRIFRHQETGSYALFANLFRYKLLIELHPRIIGSQKTKDVIQSIENAGLRNNREFSTKDVKFFSRPQKSYIKVLSGLLCM